jgi:NADP-dependent 3-hydroxy acid dehydrogenase YdfG
MGSLSGKWALVAGASSGMGRAIAVALAGAGATVIVAARRAELLQSLATEIGGHAVPTDFSRPEDIEKLGAHVMERTSALDVLVLSCGHFLSGSLTGQTNDPLPDLLAANLIAPLALAQRMLPLLVEARGDIVFINSSVVRAANLAGRAHYAASQHALKAAADGLRDEINRDGVRVTSVFPGATATPMQERIHADSGKPYRPERMLQPEDVAAAVLCAATLPETAEITELYVRPRNAG